jgi:hypothetical protein
LRCYIVASELTQGGRFRAYLLEKDIKKVPAQA